MLQSVLQSVLQRQARQIRAEGVLLAVKGDLLMCMWGAPSKSRLEQCVAECVVESVCCRVCCRVLQCVIEKPSEAVRCRVCCRVCCRVWCIVVHGVVGCWKVCCSVLQGVAVCHQHAVWSDCS